MKAGFLTFLIIVGTAAAQAKPPAKPNAAPPVPSLKLLQHCALCGDSDVYLTKSSLLLKTEKSHLNFVCQAPFREVTVYSTYSGKIVKVPVNFKNPFSSARALLAGIDLSGVPMDESGAATVCQKTCQVFKSKPAWTKEQKEKRLKKECEAGEPVEVRAEYLKSDCEPALLRLVAHIYGVPEKELLPVSLSYKEADGTAIDVKHVRTFKIESVPVQETIFQVPGGLRTVKNMNEVIQDASADGAMEMMLGH